MPYIYYVHDTLLLILALLRTNARLYDLELEPKVIRNHK
jgi:hypothetical protein